MVNLPARVQEQFPAASAKIANIPKVTPEVMMIVYLDEIAGRLAELQDALTEITAEGYLQSVKLNVSDSPVRFPFSAKHFSLYNDGASAVYVLGHDGKPLSRDAELNKSGHLNIDFQTKRSRSFWFVCSSGGSATVRVFTW